MFSLVEFEEDSGSGDDSSVVRAGAGDLVERGAVGVGELDWVFFASDCACFHAFRLTHDLHCGQALEEGEPMWKLGSGVMVEKAKENR